MLKLEIIGQGATSKIYRDGNTAIKLYENISYDEVVNEANNQKFAYDVGLPVPAIIDIQQLEANAVALHMDYIDAKPLMHVGMDKDDRREAIQTLVKLQCKVHKISAAGLPKQNERLRQRVTQTEYLTDTEKESLLTLLEKLDTDESNLCHGDFHPLNILYDGSKHWIIDWVDATAGNCLADVCRSYLIFKQYITRMAGIYLKSFCKESNVKQEDVLAWLPIVAAGRLGENLDDKSIAWLLEIIRGN